MTSTSPATNRLQNIGFWLILALYGVYAVIFIAQTIFYVNGKPYSALFDDAMISMTYARNLAAGHGLVWNPGETPVEGFTNPLWVVFMVLIHLFPVPENWTSLVVQVSGGAFFVASLVMLRKVALNVSPGQARVMLLAVLLTAFYYPLTNWSLLGLEVSVLLLMVNSAVFLALRVLDSGRFSHGMYLLLGVATLVRIDAAVTYLTLWGLMFLFDKDNRRRHLVEGFVFLGLFLGGQTLLRKLYYGEWLPNTYYLKMEGIPLWARARRGWAVFLEFVEGMYWPLVIFPFTLFLFRRDRKVILLALVFLAQVTYSIYVGGDAWEHRGGSNRFISIGMPVFMLLFSLACWHWFDWMTRICAGLLPGLKKVSSATTAIGLGLFIMFSMLMWNRLVDSYGPVTNLQNPREGALRFFLQLERSIFVPGSARYTRDALIVREVTHPEARVAMTAAGNICYFVHRPCIDLLGKSDPVIAHAGIQVPLDADWRTLQPGHVKFNYAYSIGELQPDVIVELARSTLDIGERYLDDYQEVRLNQHPMYFKKGSPYVDWEKLENVRED